MQPTAQTGAHEAQLIAERRAKLERLRAEGIEPYQQRFPDRTPIAELRAAHEDAGLEPGEHPALEYRVAGRLVARRSHGKTTFLDLVDRSGRIQVVAGREALGEREYERVLALDIGDIVGIDGCIYLTGRGELSLRLASWTLLAKALRPPPEQYHGVEDVETRFRQRELDLAANADSRELFITRARVISAIRRWYDEHGFIEVETPVLQPIYGGASARPFVTHHNALDRDVYLRIATELYLKRCIVGGLENVFELGKSFRNEGLSPEHNPEFTMVEWFQCYSDYMDVIAFIEQLVAYVAQEVLGTTVIERGGERIELAPPWRRLTVRDGLLEAVGIDILSAERAQLAEALGEDDAGLDWPHLVERLFVTRVEPTLIQPTFVLDYPIEMVPLVRSHPDDDRLGEIFDAFVGGLELASGGSDLNDPDRQKELFLQQRADEGGAADAGTYDVDYITALEYGMTPASGAGIGIDRLVMLLTGRESLREVLLFPTMRDRA